MVGGESFTKKRFKAYLTYYKTPMMNSFYILNPYPTEVPHGALGAENSYR